MCTVRKLFGILFLVCAVAQVGVGQNQTGSEVLANADVVEMINAGLSAEIVLARLDSCGCQFRTSSGALVALLRSGVPEEVIYAMVAASIRGQQPPDPEPEATTPVVREDASDVVVRQARPAHDVTFSGSIKYLGGRGFPDFGAVRNSWNNSLTITNNEITFGFRNNLIPSETIPISVLTRITYGQATTRRVAKWVVAGIFVTPALLGILHKSRQHYVLIEWIDAQEREREMLVKIHKYYFVGLLNELSFRTQKPIYTDSEDQEWLSERGVKAELAENSTQEEP